MYVKTFMFFRHRRLRRCNVSTWREVYRQLGLVHMFLCIWLQGNTLRNRWVLVSKTLLFRLPFFTTFEYKVITVNCQCQPQCPRHHFQNWRSDLKYIVLGLWYYCPQQKLFKLWARGQNFLEGLFHRCFFQNIFSMRNYFLSLRQNLIKIGIAFLIKLFQKASVTKPLAKNLLISSNHKLECSELWYFVCGHFLVIPLSNYVYR